jgi:hypothetical protein
MPKFKVKMSWLDTYEQVIEAPTEAEAIAEAQDGGDWGDPIWGSGGDQDTWAEQIEETETNDPNGLPLNFTDKYHEEPA